MPTKLTTRDFIERAHTICGKKYSYVNSNYKGNKIPIEIICSKHGSFWQKPNNHLTGQGCPMCGFIAISNQKLKSTEQFIKDATKIHHDIFTYKYTNYRGALIPVIITCKQHGNFSQRPNDHLNGSGCPSCARVQKLSNKNFLDRISKIHKKFSYPDLNIVNSKTKIKIICPTHGKFFQTPESHLLGQGCPVCQESKGEKRIRTYLEEHHKTFFSQYKILECKNKKSLPFDFAIFNDQHQLLGLIEYQGEQHYIPKSFGGEKIIANVKFIKIQCNDTIKSSFCLRHKIPLLKIPYWNKANIDEILANFLKELI